MGLNQYSDMSDKEFFEHYKLMAPQACSAMNEKDNLLAKLFADFEDRPSHVDWREEGKVSPVKNQGHCGSCWTFSTTGALEAHYRIYKNSEPIFSEQQLVDCAGDFENHGCHGGLPSHAFEYIKYTSNGLESEKDYPYEGKDGVCRYDSSKGLGHIPKGSYNITALDEDELHNCLAHAGPVSVGFQVIDDFRHYSHGVYSSDTCKNGAMDVNHAVLAVGYGVCGKCKKPYYIVKNSWGTEWGDEGYFKIEAGVNMCGIAQCNSFPNMGQFVDEETLSSLLE